MLDHGALKRLKNNTALSQFFRKHIATDQLVAGEDQAPSDIIESARSLKNSSAFFVGQCTAVFERSKIEKIDIGKSPGLIFSRWLRQRLEFFPSCALLIAKPTWKITLIDWTRKDRARSIGRSGFGCFVKNC